MRLCFLSVVFLFLGSAVVVDAQVNWSVKAGGGVSNLIILYKSDLPEKFEGSFFSQVGITLSGNFAKEAMVSWQSGLRSEEHTSELQSRGHLVCGLLLENKKIRK